MPFENFYKEADKTKRNQWMILGLVIIGIPVFIWLFWLFLSITTPREKSPEEIEEIIVRSEKLTRVDQLCKNLAKPEQFEFSYKQLGSNSIRTALSYGFKTERPNDEIEIFFRLTLTSDGWVEDKSDLQHFKKGKQTIALERSGFPDANWSIYCAEENK